MLSFWLLTTAVVAGQCGLCHPEVRVLFEASVHARESVTCVDCHGGNPEEIEVEAAHRGNYKGIPAARQIPRLCADCHSDPKRMRGYNLPTDQYALYQTSQHGIGLARGDTRVAVCTDCHGTHDILPAADPQSRVFRNRIPATCGKCHGDMALMARYGKETNVYEDYLASIHARELLHGNEKAPECASCHGVHGATPPGTGDVDRVCGSCHRAERQAFLEGPHAEGLVAAGLPECGACHGNHTVQMVVPGKLAARCAECHGSESEEAARGEQMDVLFVHAHEEISRARQLIETARQVPIYVEDHLARLETAQTYVLEAEPAVHSVSVEDVERYTHPARSLGQQIQSEIQGELNELRLRRLGLVVFWFYLLLTLWVLLRVRKTLVGGA